jgi:hypothetical protein
MTGTLTSWATVSFIRRTLLHGVRLSYLQMYEVCRSSWSDVHPGVCYQEHAVRLSLPGCVRMLTVSMPTAVLIPVMCVCVCVWVCGGGQSLLSINQSCWLYEPQESPQVAIWIHLVHTDPWVSYSCGVSRGNSEQPKSSSWRNFRFLWSE